MKLITVDNPKTRKGESEGYLTGILHLAHHKTSGYNVCPWASEACSNECLDWEGRGGMPVAKSARVRRTKLYFENPIEFYKMLYSDLEKLQKKANKLGLKVAFRPNGTSDIPKLAIQLAKDFPSIQFYDYTKGYKTLLRDDIPSNYYLTFSYSEINLKESKLALANGYNVAVPMEYLTSTLWGYPVIDGDKTDLRFTDPNPVVVGLTPKGGIDTDKGFKLTAEMLAQWA